MRYTYSREFGGQGIDLLNERLDTKAFSPRSDLFLRAANALGNLLVSKAHFLSLLYQLPSQPKKTADVLHLML